jgi:hypothetical protein
MGIHVNCEQCGYKYHLKDDLAGKKVKCKICKAIFVVPAGGPVIKHGPRAKEFEVAVGNEETIDHVTAHIQRYCGEIGMVWHEVVSDLVHVDVHEVPPTPERPYYTLVTSGMSDRPMTVPSGAEKYRYAELMLSLPAEWPISMEAFKEEDNYWPVRLLKILARFPHEYDTWLSFGHTLPNDDPPQPYAPNTKLCCALLLVPLLVDKEFWSLKVSEEKTIHFYSIVPLYREEMEFKVKHGTDPLLDKLGEHNVNELLDAKRKNVCKRGWW